MASTISLNSLPLGFRFGPKDLELVDYYLRKKINGEDDKVTIIREVDVCQFEPWDLPDMSVIQSSDPEWFFFCPVDRKYPNGSRIKRATVAGYWKATGKDRTIMSRNELIGMKKTLVFYVGRAPKAQRTNWVMHEYRTTLAELDGTKPGQGAFVLCRVFKRKDETIQDFNRNTVVPDISTPTTVQPPPVEMQSGMASTEQSEATTTQEMQLLDEKLEFFLDSPLPEELGPLGTNISEEDLNAFYQSVFNDSDDFSNDDIWKQLIGNTNTDLLNNDSGLEPQVGQPPHPKPVDGVSNPPDSCNSNIETGIKIRQRQPKDQTAPQNVSSMQGNASRRVRLQSKIQVHHTELEPTLTNGQKAEEKYIASGGMFKIAVVAGLFAMIAVAWWCQSIARG